MHLKYNDIDLALRQIASSETINTEVWMNCLRTMIFKLFGYILYSIQTNILHSYTFILWLNKPKIFRTNKHWYFSAYPTFLGMLPPEKNYIPGNWYKKRIIVVGLILLAINWPSGWWRFGVNSVWWGFRVSRVVRVRVRDYIEWCVGL